MGSSTTVCERPLTPAGRLRAWLELSRVSNLPTCVSNVLVGYAIGMAAQDSAAMRWGTLVALVVATTLFYVAGMVLNDVADLAVDRVERPGRPLPSGRIARSTALGVVVACLGLALLLALAINTRTLAAAATLAAAIVLYDMLHKNHAWSVVLMGACRGLVYVMAAVAVGRPDAEVLAWLAVALATYTVLLTVMARGEAGAGPGLRRWLALAMPAVVCAPLAALGLAGLPGWVWLLLAGEVVWLLFAARLVLARPPRTVPAILAWLAGICLVDALYLGLLDRPWLAGVAVFCFAVTIWAHRRVLGT